MKMQKADPVVIKEVRFMAIAAFVCAGLVQIGFVAFGRWDYTVALGGVIGWALTVLNFLLMSLGVQRAVSDPDPQHAQLVMKVSYTWRTILMLAVMVVSFVVEFIHWLPIVAAAFYPMIVIFIRQLWTKYVLKQTGDEPLPADISAEETDADEDDGEEDEFEKMVGSFARKIDTDYLKSESADGAEAASDDETQKEE